MRQHSPLGKDRRNVGRSLFAEPSNLTPFNSQSMKKINLLPRFIRRQDFLKTLLLMKLTIALLLFTCLQVSAKVFSQTKITLQLQSIELKKVLSIIERKSGYRFLYNDETVPTGTRVNVNAVNTPVTDVLDELFADKPLAYKILENRLVVITDRNVEVVQATVVGHVVSATGEPLVGVSVKIKGSSAGTQTDANGNFTLTVPDNATLVISYVGYETTEVPVNGRTEISISLKQSEKVMDQVVVIGYGTANKRDLTGSIIKIAGKEIADKPNTNPVASLQGKVAGLSVVNSGTPGKQPDIRIRGTASIGQVHPLYVVDGIFNDNIDYINPNDIESIEILKDPSSLAIFGVKGATGVIAITTKRAKAGQTIINFNTTIGFKKLVDKIKLANADEFKMLFAEERATDPTNPTTAPFDYTGLTANTDWIDAVTRTGTFNANNLSISTSTEKNKFNFGLGYTSDEGIIRHEKLQRMMVSLSDEFRLSKAIRFGVNINASRQDNPYDATSVLDDARKVIPQVSSATRNFRVKSPYGVDTVNMDLYSGLDVGLQSSGVVNPLVKLENEWDKTKNIEYRTVGSVFAEITFLKNFTFRSTFYGDISNVNKRQYVPLYYNYNPKTNLPELVSATTRIQEDDNDWKKFQQDHVLNYKKTIGDHSITATAGFTTYYFGNFNRTGKSSQATGVTAQPIPNDSRFWYVGNGYEDPSNTSATSTQLEYSTVSFLGRVLYNYKSRYYVNASFRDDASSRLPVANRHQQFWAVGAAWEVSREDFMKNVQYIDYLKIKGSVGVLGNQTAQKIDGTSLDYPFYPRILSGQTAVFGNNVYTAALPEYIPNPALKWETVSAQEIGFEATGFKNRLHVEFNFFNRTTRELMTYISRRSIGLDDELINGGSIRNRGEEIAASWTENVNRDFSVSVGGNITFLKNEVLSLSPDLPNGFLSRAFQNNGSAESRTMPGYAIGSFYGYVVEGIYQSYADILKSPPAGAVGSYRPGDFKFKDVNGDGKVTPDDRTVIGNPTPDFTYGANVTVNYKGLSLSVDMNGVYGNEIFRTWGSLESPFQRVNYSGDKINRWHGEGTSNWVPILGQGDRFNYNGSTYNIEDGSYFRFRNIQLSYTFNKALIGGWSIKDLRVFANVQNLKTFKHNYGYSPEYGGTGGDATAFGYDNAGGAIPMVTTFGLNISF